MIRIKEMTDIDSIMDWRREVIEHVFGEEPSPELMARNRNYYEDNIPTGRHIALEALFMEMKAGCGGVCFSEELPSPDNPSGLCGYLMNIYVREEYRKQGVAHAIVSELIRLARDRNCDKIYLETTEEGRHVYESAGFTDLPGMMKLKNYGKDDTD